MVDRDILLLRAKEMRNNPTEPEKRLWRHLSRSQLGGYKFRRQAVITTYIADFLCPAKKLIIEVDGDTHDAQRDAKRSNALGAVGFSIIRFTNEDIMKNMEGVLSVIVSALDHSADGWAPQQSPRPIKEDDV